MIIYLKNMNNFFYKFIFLIFLLLQTKFIYSLENKIIFKIGNDSFTSIDYEKRKEYILFVGDNFDLNKYSLNYLNHLFNTNEILASMILSLHNINFYQELMKSIRINIQKGTFDKFHDKYIDKL